MNENKMKQISEKLEKLNEQIKSNMSENQIIVKDTYILGFKIKTSKTYLENK